MRRKLPWILGGLVALLLIAAIALPMLVRIDTFRPRIEAALSAKLHRTVKLGTLGLRILPLPTLTVASGSVAGTPDETAPLLQFQNASARIAFWPLLHKQVDARSVDIDGLSVNLKRDQTGKYNLQTWLATLDDGAKTANTPPSPAATLARLHLTNLHILYSAPGAETPLDIPLDLTVKGFSTPSGLLILIAGQTELRFNGHFDETGVDGKFSSSKLRFSEINPLLQIAGTELPAGLSVAGLVKMDGSIKMEYARAAGAELQAALELNDGTIISDPIRAPSSVPVRGSSTATPPATAPMAEFKKASVQVAVWPVPRNQIELNSITVDGLVLRLLRDRSGKFNLETWLYGPEGAAGAGKTADPSAAASAATTGASPSSPTAAIILENLRLTHAHVFYTERGAATPIDIPLDLTLAGFGAAQGSLALITGQNTFKYDGRMDTSGLDGKFSTSNFRLEAVTPLLAATGTGLPPGFLATGAVKLNGSVKMDFAAPDKAALQAAIELSGGTLRLPTLKVPLTAVNLTAQLSPAALVMPRVEFKLLRSDMSGRARIENWRRSPRLNFDFSSDLLEMGEITDQLQAGNVEPTHSGGTGANSGPSFSADGTLQVKNGGFGIFRFSALKARVAAVPAQLQLKELSAQFYKGALNADAIINNRLGGFSFNAKLVRMDLGAFIKVAAGEPYATGSADARVNGEGRLAAWQQLTGSANITATNGVIAKFPLLAKINQALSLTGLSNVNDRDLAYDRLTADYALGGGRARTENLHLHAALLDADARGSTTFDNSLDYAGHTVLSRARSSEMTNRAGTLKYIADRDGRISLPFTAKGPAGAPAITIDTGALLKQAAGGVVEEKKEDLKQKLKDRLGDFLGGLLGGDKKSSPSSPSSP